MTATIRIIPLDDGSSTSLEIYPELASTNATFHTRFVDERERFEPFHAIATTSQTAGKGRLDREWVAPPGCTLALSVYAEFTADAAGRSIGWVSLAAGLALREVLAGRMGAEAHRIGIKWPNDVQIDGQKVAGILGELLGVVDGGRAFACVIGIGVNTGIPADELPTSQATSLQLKGVDVDPLDLAPELVAAVARRLRALDEADGDASALRAELLQHCTTIGSEVLVTLADGSALRGVATGVDLEGRLEVRDEQGEVRRVSVGDVEHVRPGSDASIDGEELGEEAR